MNRTAHRHWAGIDEATFVGGMRLLFWIFRRCGRWPFRLVLHPVLAWYVLTRPTARRASRAYLARAGVAPTIANVLRHFGAFAETILDKMLLWGGLFDTATVRFHGQAAIEALQQGGRGAVLVCSHLGNAELCRVIASRRAGIKITVLVHTRHAQAFNRLLAKLDPRSQMNLLQVTEMNAATATLLAARIEAGELIVIAGDRVPVSPQPRVARARFLGAEAAFPIGPYVMASVLQCPLYLLFSARSGESYEVHFELLRERVLLPRGSRAAALAAIAGEYAARLEHHCLRTPYQWFNFYDFWHNPDLDTTHATG